MSIYLTHSSKAPAYAAPDLQEWFSGHAFKMGVTEDDCQAVLSSVVAWARKHFGNAVVMQRTPTGFGMQLLQMSLPEGIHYEPVPEAVSRMLHGYCSLPHRIERINSLPKQWYEYDARVAYLAYCRNVPAYFRDSFIHDKQSEYVLHRQGWYLCRVQVPADWQSIGLVPGGHAKDGNQPTYVYPKQGAFIHLLHCSEVELMRQHGWQFDIIERILFAQSKHPGSDPLRAWATRLKEGIEAAELLANAGLETDAHWQLFRVALRAIALRTIGQFNFNGQADERYKKDALGWSTEGVKPTSGYLQRFHHPEWFSTITARERVQVTKIALQAPKEALVAIKADAVFTTTKLSLEDTGKVGSYRLKEVHR